jgi:uncharacterized DUF497 family protein
MYNKASEIEFDTAKDRRNRAKHGLSLTFAAKLDWDSMLAKVEDRDDYGEERWTGIAPQGSRLYTVIFTMRGETARIISLRKSSNSEIDKYEAESRK